MSYPLATTTWDADEYDALQNVIASGQFTMGQAVAECERRWAEFHDVKHAVMVNSGSSANLLALTAVRLANHINTPDGAEIVVPVVSWSTTFYPISQTGFTIRFVDIDPATLNASVQAVADAINENTCGIFAVNLLGNSNDYAELLQLAEANDLFLIEDNCESLGAEYNNQLTGTFGLLGTYSTFFSHHLSTMEGGFVTTDDTALYEILVSIRAHGWTRQLPMNNGLAKKSGDAFRDSFEFILPGYNMRPLEMSGAVGVRQLLKLPSILQGRRNNAAHFKQLFADCEVVRIQEEIGKSSWFGFSMVLESALSGQRGAVLRHLDNLGVEYRPIVAGNFARNPVIKHLRSANGNATFTGADRIHDDGFFIGNHHYDVADQLTRIRDAFDDLTRR